MRALSKLSAMNSIGACRADERRCGGTWRQCDTRTLTMIEGPIETRFARRSPAWIESSSPSTVISRAIGSVARTIAVVEAARHALKRMTRAPPVPLHRFRRNHH